MTIFRFSSGSGALRRRAAAPAVLAAVVLLSVADPLRAQNALEQSRLDEIARVAAQRFLAAREDTDQTRLTTAGLPPGTPVALTLQEATARALERNLDLVVERLNPQTFELAMARLRAAYHPIATSQVGQRAVVQPPTNQLNGGHIVQNDATDYNAGISQALPWGGGAVALQFNNRKQSRRTSSPTSTRPLRATSICC